MKTFVISIERNKERFDFLKKRLDFLNYEFEKIDGIDGSRITDEEISSIDTSYYLNKYGVVMSKYEICCALSHRKVYEKIIHDGIEKALILEDDAYFLSSTSEIIKSIEKINTYDLLYLYHGKAKKSLIYKGLPFNYRLHKYPKPGKNSKRAIIYGVAYVITKQAAARLLEIGKDKMMPADFLIGLPQLHLLKTYGIEPSCIDHGAFESSIIDRV